MLTIVLLGLLVLPTAASDYQQAVDENIETITITGSRLKPLFLEGASPVTVFDRKRIEKSGASSLAELLQGSILNTQGARNSNSGSSGGKQGQATVNLRGLGEQRTLVLINGRRIANSATIPDSQNINLIPLAAIERIEILKDGASSVYGADALGGVVNIILYKNRSDHQVSINISRPQSQGGDVDSVEFTGGFSVNKANISYALSHSEQQALYYRDFEITKVGLSPFGYPGSYTAFTEDENTGELYSLTVPDSRCPLKMGSDESYPRSQVKANLCQYNFADASTSQPQSTFDSVMVDGQLNLSSKSQFYAQLFVSRNSTYGMSAPTPHAGGISFLPTMSAENPNNPTIDQTLFFDTSGDGDGDTPFTGPFNLDIYFRNVAAGPRSRKVIDKMTSSQLGWKYDFGGDNSEIELSIFYDNNTSDEDTFGLSRRDLLQAAINDTSFDLFSVNNETDDNLAKSFRFDSGFSAKFESKGFRGHYKFDWFNKNINKPDSVIGLEYITYDYRSMFEDSLTGNQLDGRAGGGNANGKRDVFSIFSESNFPLSQNLAMNLALRFDQYSDFGSTVNPRLGLVYKLSKNWILRTSISTGFRAPSLFELFSDKNQGFVSVIDQLNCDKADINANGSFDNQEAGFNFNLAHPCSPVRVQTVTEGNSALDAEKSKSLSIGSVYQPDGDLRFSFNFYLQQFSNQILRLPPEEVTRREAELGANERVHRNSNGIIQSIDLNYDNFSGVQTQGIDLELTHTLIDNHSGRWGYFISATGVIKYQAELLKGDGFRDIEGDSDGRAEFGIDWQINDIDARLKINYVPASENAGVKFNRWILTEFNLNWQISSKGKITFGIINLFDVKPPNDPNIGFPYYQSELFALQGKMPYLRFRHSF